MVDKECPRRGTAQFKQKRAWTGLLAPQEGHTNSETSAWEQDWQKRATSRFWVPHCGQSFINLFSGCEPFYSSSLCRATGNELLTGVMVYASDNHYPLMSIVLLPYQAEHFLKVTGDLRCLNLEVERQLNKSRPLPWTVQLCQV